MKKVQKILKSIGIIALLGTSLFAQADRLRLGHVTPPTHIWHQVAEKFHENLQKESGGKHSINIFPLSQLGGDDQMVAMLQSGGIQLGIITVGVLANRVDSMNAWFLPYIFKDVEDAAAATKLPAAQKFLKDLEQQRLVGLGYTMAGMRHVLSTKPINRLEDFANKKIRSFPNKVYNDWWQQLGAAPTALAIGDVSSALTTNLLDAVDVDLDILVGLKMYQQAPNLILTNHMAFPAVAVASKRWWDRLSDDYKAMVIKAFKDAEEWGFQKQAEAEITNLELLRKAGVNIQQFDPATVQPVVDKIISDYTSQNSDINTFYKQQTGN